MTFESHGPTPSPRLEIISDNPGLAHVCASESLYQHISRTLPLSLTGEIYKEWKLPVELGCSGQTSGSGCDTGMSPNTLQTLSFLGLMTLSFVRPSRQHLLSAIVCQS